MKDLDETVLVPVIQRCGNFLRTIGLQNLKFDNLENYPEEKLSVVMSPAVFKEIGKNCKKVEILQMDSKPSLDNSLRKFLGEVANWDGNLTDLELNCDRLFEGNQVTNPFDELLSVIFKKNINIRCLILTSIAITGKCLLSLQPNTIESLILDDCLRNFDAGLRKFLSTLKNLKVLMWDNDDFSIALVTETLRGNCYNLEGVNFVYKESQKQLDKNFEMLISCNRNLGIIEMLDYTLSPKCLSLLKADIVERIDVMNCKFLITWNKFIEQVSLFPKLQTLMIYECSFEEPCNKPESIISCPSLKHLQLSEVRLPLHTTTGQNIFEGLVGLEYLGLDRNIKVDDNFLIDLCPKLTQLKRHARFTAQSVLSSRRLHFSSSFVHMLLVFAFNVYRSIIVILLWVANHAIFFSLSGLFWTIFR